MNSMGIRRFQHSSPQKKVPEFIDQDNLKIERVLLNTGECYLKNSVEVVDPEGDRFVVSRMWDDHSLNTEKWFLHYSVSYKEVGQPPSAPREVGAEEAHAIYLSLTDIMGNFEIPKQDFNRYERAQASGVISGLHSEKIAEREPTPEGEADILERFNGYGIISDSQILLQSGGV